MKKILIFFLVVMCVGSRVDAHVVSALQLKYEMKNNPKMKVINVLNKNSFKDCSIPGSISIPLDKLDKYTKKWNRDKRIVVHCANYDCPLSRYAYQKLKDQGFTHVGEFAGGTKEWVHKGYPVHGPCNAGYLQK